MDYNTRRPCPKIGTSSPPFDNFGCAIRSFSPRSALGLIPSFFPKTSSHQIPSPVKGLDRLYLVRNLVSPTFIRMPLEYSASTLERVCFRIFDIRVCSRQRLPVIKSKERMKPPPDSRIFGVTPKVAVNLSSAGRSGRRHTLRLVWTHTPVLSIDILHPSTVGNRLTFPYMHIPPPCQILNSGKVTFTKRGA